MKQIHSMQIHSFAIIINKLKNCKSGYKVAEIFVRIKIFNDTMW